jgi:hypothetical protein
MSTLAESYYPPPRSWDALEGIVLDVFAKRLRNPALKRHGRSGQQQHGVDIAGLGPAGLIGLQCKNHPGGRLKPEEIDAEIARAEQFRPPLAHYIVATSASRDSALSSHLLAVSQERTAVGKFSVEVFFWEDICNELSRSPELLGVHFPQLNLQQPPPQRPSPVEKLTQHSFVTITPIFPITCNTDQFHITAVKEDHIVLQKCSSSHGIDLPANSVRQVITRNPNGTLAVVLEGRLQWISCPRTWSYFPESPVSPRERQLGFDKIISPRDPAITRICAALATFGREVRFAREDHLAEHLGLGWQLVYDDDGLYLRWPGDVDQILVASGP